MFVLPYLGFLKGKMSQKGRGNYRIFRYRHFPHPLAHEMDNAHDAN